MCDCLQITKNNYHMNQKVIKKNLFTHLVFFDTYTGKFIRCTCTVFHLLCLHYICRHTSFLENFYSMMLKYAPKRNSFEWVHYTLLFSLMTLIPCKWMGMYMYQGQHKKAPVNFQKPIQVFGHQHTVVDVLQVLVSFQNWFQDNSLLFSQLHCILHLNATFSTRSQHVHLPAASHYKEWQTDVEKVVLETNQTVASRTS